MELYAVKQRRRLTSIHDYVDVTPEMSRRIGLLWQQAFEEHDSEIDLEERVTQIVRTFTDVTY